MGEFRYFQIDILEKGPFYEWKNLELEMDLDEMTAEEQEDFFMNIKEKKVDCNTEQRVIKIKTKRALSREFEKYLDPKRIRRDKYYEKLLSDVEKFREKGKTEKEFKKYIESKMAEYDKENKTESEKSSKNYKNDLEEITGIPIIEGGEKKVVSEFEAYKAIGRSLAKKLRDTLRKTVINKKKTVKKRTTKRINMKKTIKAAWRRTGSDPFKNGSISIEDTYTFPRKIKADIYLLPDMSGSVAGYNLTQIQLNLAATYFYFKEKGDSITIIPFGLKESDLEVIDAEYKLEYLLNIGDDDLGGCTPLAPAIRLAREYANKKSRKNKERIMIIASDGLANATDKKVSEDEINNYLTRDEMFELGGKGKEVKYEIKMANKQDGFKIGFILVGEKLPFKHIIDGNDILEIGDMFEYMKRVVEPYGKLINEGRRSGERLVNRIIEMRSIRNVYGARIKKDI